MRARYKVRGGKLVAVEFEVAAGRLVRPRLAGDFFLEPDDALERIEAGLTGQSVEASVDQLTQAIEAQLWPGDRLIGFGPRDVAFAVRRALGAATTWDDHRFELIVDGPRPPHVQMALDEVYAQALADGRRGPTLRLWTWERPAVVLGSFQSYRNEVDQAGADQYGVTVTRRISGGGAMFIEPGNTITYSVVVPGSLVDGLTFEESYEFLDTWVLVALRQLGLDVAYAPLNDIVSPAGKIAGAAQKRLADGTVLHHVTMAYDIDAAKMTRVLRIGRTKLSDKGLASANKRVDPLRSQTKLSRQAIVDHLIAAFGAQYHLTESAVRPDEERAALELVETKFGGESWIHRVP